MSKAKELIPKTRFPEYTYKWDETSLGEISTIVKEKAGKQKYLLMSVTSGVGLVPQTEKFGKDRVSVDIKNKDDSGNAITPKLTFRTTIPGDGATKETDDSSILKVTGGNYETLSALGLRAGLSNRTNFDEKVDLSAFGPAEEKEIPVKDKDGNDTGETVKEYWYKFKLNGEDIQVRGDENGFATKKDLINAINNSNANVTVTYQEAADKFTFTSKVNGASGVIDFSKNSVDANNKLSEVFGLNRDKMNDSVRGQDAIVAVKYAGAVWL